MLHYKLAVDQQAVCTADDHKKMQEKSIVQLVVFFVVVTAAVYTGNYLYGLRHKAKIAPPDTTAITPGT